MGVCKMCVRRAAMKVRNGNDVTIKFSLPRTTCWAMTPRRSLDAEPIDGCQCSTCLENVIIHLTEWRWRRRGSNSFNVNTTFDVQMMLHQKLMPESGNEREVAMPSSSNSSRTHNTHLFTLRVYSALLSRLRFITKSILRHRGSVCMCVKCRIIMSQSTITILLIFILIFPDSLMMPPHSVRYVLDRWLLKVSFTHFYWNLTGEFLLSDLSAVCCCRETLLLSPFSWCLLLSVDVEHNLHDGRIVKYKREVQSS